MSTVSVTYTSTAENTIVAEWEPCDETLHLWSIQENQNGYRRYSTDGSNANYFESEWANPAIFPATDPINTVPASRTPKFDLRVKAVTQPVNPTRCKYRVWQEIDGAPLTPALPSYEEKAEKAIRSHISRTYQRWPTCAFGGTVNIKLLYHHDKNAGEVYRGVFKCSKCEP